MLCQHFKIRYFPLHTLSTTQLPVTDHVTTLVITDTT